MTGVSMSPFEVVLLQRLNKAARDASLAGRKAVEDSNRQIPMKKPQRGMKRK